MHGRPVAPGADLGDELVELVRLRMSGLSSTLTMRTVGVCSGILHGALFPLSPGAINSAMRPSSLHAQQQDAAPASRVRARVGDELDQVLA